MAISFNSIPNNLRVPFFAVEFDNSQASQGPALLAYRGLILAQKTSGGSGVADTLYKVSSVDQAIALGGRGSLLHRMVQAWRAANTITELWVGVLADDGAGVAAQGTITVTGTATAPGTIALYLGAERITIGVNIGDTQNTIATNINAGINAALDLPITTAPSTNVVTWTFRHKGLTGNGYNVRHSFRDGEALPAGVTLAIASTTAGTANPSLAGIFAAASDLWFQVIAHPYTDATNLTAIETEMLSRFGPLRSMDGLAVTCAVGTFSALTTLGGGRNSQSSVIFAQPGVTPLTPAFEFAAEAAALIARYGAIDPARPFQTLAMTRAIAPAEIDQFDLPERNLMLFDGISPTKRTVSGGVELSRVITTYQTAPSGADDPSYLDACTMLTLLFFRYSWRVRMGTKYPRHKLADDGTRFGPGQAVMTPSLGKAEALSWFQDMETLGLAEGREQFKADLVVERDTVNRNQMNWLLSPDVVNQLIGAPAKMQFRV